MLASLPKSIATLLVGRHIRPIMTGESGAQVLRCEKTGTPALFLKIASLGQSVDTLHDEAARLRWMLDHELPVPEVLHYEVSDDVEYLLLNEIPGADASVHRSAEMAPAIVAALADGLRLLHATPTAACPFRHHASSRVAEARERVRAGTVDETDFDVERRGLSAQQLLDELEATQPVAEDAVFAHGDYSLPNIILRDRHGSAALSGFIDCARAGVADRYQDLALAARSIASNLGSEWVSLLFECYGLVHVDECKLRFYTLLDEFF